MRTFYLALGVMIFAAAAARADVSDSGSLLIGQQAVIGGTMTVQGNAFSVGGTTFSVSAGTVSVGGLLKPSAAGIQWADNTVSTTASAGAGGGSTNLVWYASGTVLPLVSPTIFSSTHSYRIEFAFTNTATNSTGHMIYFRLNSDSGANYLYNLLTLQSGAVQGNIQSSAGGDNTVLSPCFSSNDAAAAGDNCNGTLKMTTAQTLPHRVQFNGTAYWVRSTNTRPGTSMLGMQWNGSADPSTLTVGSYSGTASLEVRVYKDLP